MPTLDCFAALAKTAGGSEMPKRTDLSNTLCPVGRSAELLGDRLEAPVSEEQVAQDQQHRPVAEQFGRPPDGA